MTNWANKTLLRDRKRWRIKQIDELDDGGLDEEKCPQKIGILPGPTKKWQIKWIDELDNDELDEFHCVRRPNTALLLAGKKLKSTYESLELTTATRLPTVIHHAPKFYDVIYGLRPNVNNDPTLDLSTV